MKKSDFYDAITKQALTEIEFARRHKKGKISNWQKNESMVYGQKLVASSTRANVELGKAQEFVQSLMSKVDEPLSFKYFRRKLAQKKRVERLNSLKEFDANRDFWDLKDLAGKKQAIVYGRAIFTYFADSIDNNYLPHLENVDVYDFLIDPLAGGLDIERAGYLGNYGVIKSRSELEKGLKEKRYLKEGVTKLLAGDGNSDEPSQEDTDKENRVSAQNVDSRQKEIQNKDKFKFWNWFTTFEGERYYLVMTESGCAISIKKLSEVFKSGQWPFWSYASFIDLTEFWTPSYVDYVREIFMAQAVSINQALDNSDQINNPQKIVDVTALEDLADLKFKRDGLIRITPGADATKAVQFVDTKSIDTPLKLYDILEAIHEKASGVTAGSKGVEEEGQLATIYEGNQANTADRYGLFNKTYAFGYRRFAVLYEAGVRENLKKKVAVDILGPDGVDIEEIGVHDIFRKNESFGIIVESSMAEEQMSLHEKKTKINFLQAQANRTDINQMKSFEIQAKIAGIDDETIRQLKDVSDYGDADLMSEAERDIERLLEGEKVKPNGKANTAYMQRLVDYMMDHEEDVDAEQAEAVWSYIDSLEETVIANTIQKIKVEKVKMMQEMTRKQMLMMTDPSMQGDEANPMTGAPMSEAPTEIMPSTNEDRTITGIETL